RSFTIEVMLQSTSTTHAALIDSSATGTFVSLELALPSKEIGKLIKLQLFDSTFATSGLITHHHSDVISLANGLDSLVDLLVTRLYRTMSIILGLLWLHDANPNIDWKLMTIMFKAEDAQLTASFFLKSRSTPPSKKLLMRITQSPPTLNPSISLTTILLPTPSLTFSKPNIVFLKLSPKLFNYLDIRIINAASFAWIIWKSAQAYQLHISPSLPEEHL
ncbi:hypothetical protein C0995_016187, partial [Termitomyces sp. Mi166